MVAKTISTENRDLIIEIAKLYLDSPYLFSGNGTVPGDYFDCSRFSQIILSNVGITIERTATVQAEQFLSKGGIVYDLSQAEVGDLIFYKNTYETQSEITHVGFYAGNNKMINATGKKVQIETIAKYWKDHFKGVGKINVFSKDFNRELALKNYDKLSDKETIEKERTLKAVNAVIAVLTSTRGDLPPKYQDLSASYAKKLRTDYPEARKLEPDQVKKIYQSVVDMISYAWKFAGYTEQKKYEELAKYLRDRFGLQ